jgi:hypothetical protein
MGMLPNQCCPTCHRPWADLCAGVYLPRVKAQIFDAIKASGDVGLQASEIMERIYTGNGRRRAVIRNHIAQINERLEETDYRLVCDGRGIYARWHLRKIKVRVAA